MKMTPHLIAGAVVLAIIGFGFLLWNVLTLQEPDSPVFGPPTVPEAPTSVPGVIGEGISPSEPPESDSGCVPVPQPELPSLDQSDDFVWTQMDDCLAALVPGEGPIDILRRLAAVMENASRGELSRAGFAIVEVPAGEFSIATRGKRHYIDDATFRRYDATVDALTCVPPQRLATLVRLFRPLLAQSLRDLGLPDADVDAVIDDALRGVLAVPAPLLPIEVVQTDKGYAYAHEKLEAASPLSKQLVRLGPDNLLKLQRYAREVRAELRQPGPECVD